MNPKSMHIMLDMWGIPYETLNDLNGLLELLKDATKNAGCKIVGVAHHKYSPQGVSIVLLVAESHISIHTYPEEEYCAVDIFTCGKTDAKVAAEYLVYALKPTYHNIIELIRGVR